MSPSEQSSTEKRARASGGISGDGVYRMVTRALESRGESSGAIVDVGCGTGNLWPYVRHRFGRYVGVDVVRYESFPEELDFRSVDLDSGRIDLPDGSVDVTTAVETIEHLENPRAFMRELVRITRPGGWILVTTPNQRSLLSLIALIVKGKHVAFQDVHYPAHITALLESDLERMAAECGLGEVEIDYSREGRVVLTPWRYPRALSRLFPRACSDNLMMVGRKPLT